MITVYKYPLVVIDAQQVYLPEGAKGLTVQLQGGQPCLWALVDDQQKEVSRTVRLMGTGHDFKLDASMFDYVGTFQLNGGMLVFHVFLEVPK